MTRDEIDVQGPRTPTLIAHPIGGAFELVRPSQPAVGVALRVVGDQHGVEEGTLLDAAPRVGLVDRRHRAQGRPEPVDDRLQPGQPVPRFDPMDNTTLNVCSSRARKSCRTSAASAT